MESVFYRFQNTEIYDRNELLKIYLRKQVLAVRFGLVSFWEYMDYFATFSIYHLFQDCWRVFATTALVCKLLSETPWMAGQRLTKLFCNVAESYGIEIVEIFTRDRNHEAHLFFFINFQMYWNIFIFGIMKKRATGSVLKPSSVGYLCIELLTLLVR